MKLIQALSDMIQDEIEGAKEYAKCAVLHKEDNPTLANAFYTISTQELAHVNILHEEVVKIINQYKAENGAPPESMQAVYNYLHEKHIEEVNEVKMYQAQYRGN